MAAANIIMEYPVVEVAAKAATDTEVLDQVPNLDNQIREHLNMETQEEQVHRDLMLTQQVAVGVVPAVRAVQQDQQEALVDQAEQVQSQDHQLHMLAAVEVLEIKMDQAAVQVAPAAVATVLAVTQDLRVVEQQTEAAAAVEAVALQVHLPVTAARALLS